jgi:hypothetical protein
MQNERVEPLNEEEAHDKANMMRGHLQIDPSTGDKLPSYKEMWFGGMDHKPTAEDYDKALAYIEKVAELAKKDPDKRIPIAEGMNLALYYPILVGRLAVIAALSLDYAAASGSALKNQKEDLLDKAIETFIEETKKAMYYGPVPTPTAKVRDLQARGEDFSWMEKMNSQNPEKPE